MHLFRRADNRRQPFTIVIIACAAIVAMTISFWIGIQQSVWFDEAYSVLVAQHSVGEIIPLVSVDTHPPGYYLLLHAWGNAFGWDAAPLRLLSVLALGASIVVAGLLVRRMFGDRAAVIAACLSAISPLLLRYGFEIRMYAIASLIGVLATYMLVAARDNAGKWAWRWIVYALLVAGGMLTLYHLAFLWVAHLMWLAYQDRRQLRRVWLLPWARAYAAAFLLFIPWLPKFLGQIGNGALANIGQPMNLEQLLGVLTFNLFYQPLWQTGVTVAFVVTGVIIAAVWAWRRVMQGKGTTNKQYVWLLAAYIGVPVLLFMAASYLRPLYVERYLSQVAIGLIMLIAVLLSGATQLLPRWRRVLAVGAVAAMFLSGVYNLAVVGNFNFQRMQKPAVADIAQSIDCTGATVIAADPYVATELSFYVPPTCDVRFYSAQASLGGGYAPFSDSPLRLASTNVPRITQRLYYVYYDSPQLTIAHDYTKRASKTEGGLTLETYQAAS